MTRRPHPSRFRKSRFEHSAESGTNLPAIAEAIASAGGEKRKKIPIDRKKSYNINMSESRDRLETQQRLEEWTKKANLLWTQDAHNVMRILDQGFDTVIVDGPWGSGKSECLVPEIEQVASRQGWYHGKFDARKIAGVHRKGSEERKITFEHELSRFPQFDVNTDTALMILDESGVLETEDATGEFIDECYRQGYKKLVIIPAGGSENIRTDMILTLQKTLKRRGKSDAVYKLEKHPLPEDLAREYFDITKTPMEVVDFILSVFPMYVSVIYRLGGNQSIDSVRQWWESNRIVAGFPLRGLSRNEIEVINQKIGS